MHSAPSVSYPVGPTRGLAIIFLTLCAVSQGAVMLWCYQSHSVGWRQALGQVAWLAATWLGWRSWQRLPRGRIHWSGQSWSWEIPASDVAGRVLVAVDAQSALLLRWQSPDGTDAQEATDAGSTGGDLWLWLARSSSPADWLALRRAVYSPATSHP